MQIDTTGKKAQVLIFPYYSANNGIGTEATIKNASPNYKSIKIRFHESKLGLDVLDFNAYLAPFEEIRLSLSLNANGVATLFRSSDTRAAVCTYPTLPNNGVSLKADVYKYSSIHDGREGYLEVIENGTISDPEIKNGLSQGQCEIISKAWKTGLFTHGGAASANGSYGAVEPAGLSRPTGGLQGKSRLIDFEKRQLIDIPVIGIANYSDVAQHYNADNADFYLLPSLASGSNKTAMNAEGSIKTWNVTADYGLTDSEQSLSGYDITSYPPTGINPNPIAFALTVKTALLNYSATEGGTDWIITRPMRPYSNVKSSTYKLSIAEVFLSNQTLSRSVSVLAFDSRFPLNSNNSLKIAFNGKQDVVFNLLPIKNEELNPLIAVKAVFPSIIKTTGNSTITGSVSDFCTGQLLPSITVNTIFNNKAALFPDDWPEALTTNANGEFTLKSAAAGRYIFETYAAQSGYQSSSLETTINDNTSTDINLKLIPIKGCDPVIKNTGLYKAIIVAGTGSTIDGSDNAIWPYTQLLTDKAFMALRKNGFSDEDIRYLSADGGSHDANNDGVDDIDDIDDIATVNTLNEAITWANDADNVVVYLIGHGAPESWNINDKEKLKASALKVSLDKLQAKIKGKLIVVIEACYSGSFIAPLAAPNRYIITSTSKDTIANVSNAGLESFSFYFWDSVGFNSRIRDAFKQAKLGASAFQVGSTRQKAVLDANGDGVETEADYALISPRCFGTCAASASLPPSLGQPILPNSLEGHLTAELTIPVDVNTPLAKVWATVIRPDFVFPNDGRAIAALPLINLQCNENDKCTVTYDKFNVNGDYTFTFYAQDKAGTVSLPRTITIKQSKISAPVISSSATYNADSGVVTLKDVAVNDKHYYVELQDTGNYIFNIKYTLLLQNATANPSASYNDATKQLTIPRITVASHAYIANLSHTGDFVFRVLSATDVNN